MPLNPSGFHPIRIQAIHQETPDAISVTLDAPHFTPQPGQYLTLRATIDGQETRRSYSICSGPGEPLRIAIKRVDQGRFSTWAHAGLTPGATIEALPPAGRFTLAPGPAARVILAVAAGSGITPILSILKHLLAHEPNSRATLLYGSRATAEILFREELEELKNRHMTRLAIHHVLSREQQDIPILNGRLDGPKVLALLGPTRPDIALLCGPGTMIQSVTAALAATGMDPETIRSERFALDGEPARAPRPAPARTTAPFATATILADGLQTEIPVAADETLLDAALRAGLDLPFSCRAGMCSTCRARITRGAVTMDVNYGLEPWETRAGYVLTCQARPTTPTITADYDHV